MSATVHDLMPRIAEKERLPVTGFRFEYHDGEGWEVTIQVNGPGPTVEDGGTIPPLVRHSLVAWLQKADS